MCSEYSPTFRAFFSWPSILRSQPMHLLTTLSVLPSAASAFSSLAAISVVIGAGLTSALLSCVQRATKERARTDKMVWIFMAGVYRAPAGLSALLVDVGRGPRTVELADGCRDAGRGLFVADALRVVVFLVLELDRVGRELAQQERRARPAARRRDVGELVALHGDAQLLEEARALAIERVRGPEQHGALQRPPVFLGGGRLLLEHPGAREPRQL